MKALRNFGFVFLVSSALADNDGPYGSESKNHEAQGYRSLTVDQTNRGGAAGGQNPDRTIEIFTGSRVGQDAPRGGAAGGPDPDRSIIGSLFPESPGIDVGNAEIQDSSNLHGGSGGGQDQDRTIGNGDGAIPVVDEEVPVVGSPTTGVDGQEESSVGQEEEPIDSGIGNTIEVIQQEPSNGVIFSDGKTLSFSGVFEFFPCSRFSEDPLAQQKSLDQRGDFECRDNSCPNGCCREFDSYLLCDEDNHFPNRRCICNENTFQHRAVNDSTPNGNQNSLTTSPTSGATALPTTFPSSIPTSVPTTMPSKSITSSPVNSNPGTNVDTENDRTDNEQTGDVVDLPNNTGPEVEVDNDDGLCFPGFEGSGLGIPPQDPATLPLGMMPGDCTKTAHCQPSSIPSFAVCCLKDLCICWSFANLDDCRS